MFLYLIQNQHSYKFYIGVTGDLEERIRKHNTKNKSFTGTKKGKWELISYKELDDDTARKEELRLKRSKNKKYIYWYFTQRVASSTGRANPS